MISKTEAYLENMLKVIKTKSFESGDLINPNFIAQILIGIRLGINYIWT
jgi:hypothetical protein